MELQNRDETEEVPHEVNEAAINARQATDGTPEQDDPRVRRVEDGPLVWGGD